MGTASATSILSQLSEQKNGFKFGDPQRLDERALSVVLPIIRETSVVRQYVTLPETDKVSIHDSGSISKMKASSVSTENVFIRSGTIFKGATQERASVRSMIVFPGQTVDIEVRCVHHSRGISPNAKVTYGGITPMSVDNAVYGAGFTASDQQSYWRNVSQTSALYANLQKSADDVHHQSGQLNWRVNRQRPQASGRAMRSSGAMNSRNYATMDSATLTDAGSVADPLRSAFVSGGDDLLGSLGAFAHNFDDLLSKIKPAENQTGLALINEKGCQTIETFDVPLSWGALHTDAVKRVGSHVVNLDDTSVFQYKPENAVRSVQSVLALDYKTNLIYEHKPANGEPYVAISGITAKDYVGEVVEVDNRIIHLLILKTAN
jgi:hypothetical protein